MSPPKFSGPVNAAWQVLNGAMHSHLGYSNTDPRRSQQENLDKCKPLLRAFEEKQGYHGLANRWRQKVGMEQVANPDDKTADAKDAPRAEAEGTTPLSSSEPTESKDVPQAVGHAAQPLRVLVEFTPVPTQVGNRCAWNSAHNLVPLIVPEADMRQDVLLSWQDENRRRESLPIDQTLQQLKAHVEKHLPPDAHGTHDVGACGVDLS